jgi:hypothetical protein
LQVYLLRIVSAFAHFENGVRHLTRPEDKVTTYLFCSMKTHQDVVPEQSTDDNSFTSSALTYLLEYKIAIAIPDGGITYMDLAEKTNVNDASELRQMLARLVADRVFVEPKPGQVAHTRPLNCYNRGWEIFTSGW